MNRVPEIFLSEVFGELRIIEENNKFISALWMSARHWGIRT